MDKEPSATETLASAAKDENTKHLIFFTLFIFFVFCPLFCAGAIKGTEISLANGLGRTGGLAVGSAISIFGAAIAYLMRLRQSFFPYMTAVAVSLFIAFICFSGVDGAQIIVMEFLKILLA